MAEALVMVLLYFLPQHSIFGLAILDSALLVALVSPTLYVFLFRPLSQHIRERERIEELLRKSEDEQFKVMLRTSIDAFQITDMGRRILEVNDAFCEITKYSREELLSMSAGELEVGVSVEQIRDYLNQLRKSGSNRLEIRMHRKDGQVRIVQISSNFSDIHGGRIYNFLRDVTEHNKAEQELEEHRLRLEQLVATRTEQLNKQTEIYGSANSHLADKLDTCKSQAGNLKRTAEEYRNLYEDAPCGYLEIDSGFLLRRINDTAARWFGVTREEVLGKNIRFYELLAGDSRNRFLEAYQLLDTEFRLARPVELEILCTSGSTLRTLADVTTHNSQSERTSIIRVALIRLG